VRHVRAGESTHSASFTDEIDAVGRQRGVGLGGGNDEREQTLNQPLRNGRFQKVPGVTIAANRPTCSTRPYAPGPFRRQVVPLPDIRGREQILLVHMRKVPLAPDVKADIARGTLSPARTSPIQQRGAARRAQEQAPGGHGRFRDGQGQPAHGR
jgi:cell division protease FtsH